MIFVTVGSQKFQFNRLLKKIDKLLEEKIIKDNVFAQIGYSDYSPLNYEFKQFLNRVEFSTIIEKTSVVITHGGTGSVITAVKMGKKVIAIPRLSKYGEHVDDHQLQLLKEFEEMGIISVCYDLEDLGTIYNQVLTKSFPKYVSNTVSFLENIEDFINSL